MKRYLVFFYPKYYPSGGMEDFIDSFDNFDDAVAEIYKQADAYKYDNETTYSDVFEYNQAHIYDLTTEKTLYWTSNHEQWTT